MFSDKTFEGYIYGKCEGLMTGVQYGINDGVCWCVVGGLGTDFDVDSDVIKLGLDEGIDIGFQIDILMTVVIANFRVLWQESKMLSILMLDDFFYDGLGTCFDVDAYLIPLGIKTVWGL